MTTELPTYEEAQALSMDPGNFLKIQEQHRPLESEIRIPDSPPPSWSPPRALVHPPPDCSVNIFSVEEINEQNPAQQSTVYQIFGRTSPNRVHRKFTKQGSRFLAKNGLYFIS